MKIKIIHLLQERQKLRERLLEKLRYNKLLLSEPEKVESIDDTFLRKFAEQIEAVYADPEYNVEKLSETLGLSRGHLHRKIKELTGTAPVEFLRTYRLNKATQLLRQNAYTVSEVAYRTGFSRPLTSLNVSRRSTGLRLPSINNICTIFITNVISPHL